VDDLRLPNEFIVFHCLSNEYFKDWADDKWLELVRRLKTVWGGSIVEVGTKSCLAERAPSQVINLCGRVSIMESAEIIRRAKLFVGVDSGPAHLGNAVGTYGIVLLGDYKAFRHYMPFTGDYASGRNATLLYAQAGPARQIRVDRVFREIMRAVEKPSAAGAREFAPGSPDGPRIQGRDGGEVRLIAFYLPQYHPIPENDRWWGRGFTDWRNVMQGKQLFEGHYQPHLPGEFGFYDLRVGEVLCRQAELARQAKIAGFCFWHYWFNGKLLLEQPLLKLLESGQPDFPFCLAWANENWTRRWDGQENDILMRQEYGGQKDDKRHFAWLLRFFRDPRYLKIQGRPLFLIYRPFHMKDAAATLGRWKRMARQEGIPNPFFMAIRTNLDSRSDASAVKLGFDGELGFQPNSPGTHHKILDLTTEMHRLFPELYSEEMQLLKHRGVTVCEYDQAWPIMANSPIVPMSSSACIVPSWDNSARRISHGAFIIDQAAPPSYQRWLRYEIERCLEEPSKPQVLFLNAWNEWAEGNHLEPDLKFGDGFLESTRRALEKVRRHREPSAEDLQRATNIARIQPLVRRVVRAIHLGKLNQPPARDAEPDENLLGRITAVVSAAARASPRKARGRDPMIPVIREFLKSYPAAPLLTQLYNQASALMENKKEKVAELLFTLLAEATDTVLPDLCGKSYYKLAILSGDRKETVRHLIKCIAVYPEHRAAAELLARLRKEER
jgi:hypothetical protein